MVRVFPILFIIERMMKLTKFSPAFYIGSISIGTVEGASCVNLGNNLPSNFTNYKKHNQGFGNISGDQANVHDILASLEEKDTSDVFGYEKEENEETLEINQMVKELMMNSELNIQEEGADANESTDLSSE